MRTLHTFLGVRSHLQRLQHSLRGRLTDTVLQVVGPQLHQVHKETAGQLKEHCPVVGKAPGR